jgi:hypothetical protein
MARHTDSPIIPVQPAQKVRPVTPLGWFRTPPVQEAFAVARAFYRDKLRARKRRANRAPDDDTQN